MSPDLLMILSLKKALMLWEELFVAIVVVSNRFKEL
jgi:hypothetical protein